MMSDESRLQPKLKLNNEVEIPVLGLGVYQVPPGRVTQNAVKHALSCGYRHFDTARLYGNESDVAKAVRESGVPREEVFITTKLWNDDQGYASTLHACEESLSRLGVSQIDLYLIHWPVPSLRRETWKAMTTLLQEGRCRAIGVSNYTIRHLKELLDNSDVVPAVNQVEFSPFLYQKELLDYCKGQGIQLEAYSPLTRGERLSHPTIATIARKYQRTPAQILIRWSLQHRLVAIPKSVNPERIRENSQVFDFEIGGGEMRVLDSLNENLHTSWNPSDLA